jgi:replicative DNA helicase
MSQVLFEPGEIAPHSQQAEEAVLGSVLINPDAYYEVAGFLTSEDFFILRNGWIWEAMERLNERGAPLEFLTVVEELKTQGRLDDIGGSAYVTYLASNTATSVHAEAYGRIVERSAIRRRMLEAAGEITQLAREEDADINEVIDRAEGTLFAVTEKRLKKETIPLEVAISEYFDRIERLYTNQDDPLGVPSGFLDIDHILGGFQKSDLLILAARPGMGKTSLMLNVAMNAVRSKARVGFFSLEMSNEQLVQRLISTETGINSQKLRLGQLDDREWDLFVHATNNVSKLQLYLDDTPALSVLQLRTKARRLDREHGLDLIVVDYLQLMTAGLGNRSDNRVQEISYISRGLKELARELEIPILAGAQLSRAVEQRTDKRPQLSDLRESGCLAGDTLIALADSGKQVPIRDLVKQSGFAVWALNEDTMKIQREIVSRVFTTGIKPIFCLTTQLGRSIRATANHRFRTIHGWKRLDELQPGDHIAVPRKNVSRGRAAHTAKIVGSGDLMRLAESDVYWDRIKSIEEDGTEEVFDMTVPTVHNFTADGIIVHNSIEQDADVVMFIYRDDVYNEASDRPNEADIIVAKHRNGPTGNAVLYFRKQLTQFANIKKTEINLENF